MLLPSLPMTRRSVASTVTASPAAVLFCLVVRSRMRAMVPSGPMGMFECVMNLYLFVPPMVPTVLNPSPEVRVVLTALGRNGSE